MKFKYMFGCFFIVYSSMVLPHKNSLNQLGMNEIVLKIVPHICIAPRGQKSCISTIDISWTSQRPGDYCLASSIVINDLECWNKKDSGFYQHKIIFNENITYEINNALTKMVLINAQVKFKLLKPHRKFNKRRNRFPWSIGSL